MPTPLGEKPVIGNTHPLLEHRLAAARNGWVQNPCGAKNKLFTGWNRIACDENAINTLKEWRSTGERFCGTGIRVVGNLAVYDSDITIPEIADLVLDDFFSIDPDAYNAAIMRDSGRVTLALFFPTDKPFLRPHFKTRNYTAHPERIPEWHAANAALAAALIAGMDKGSEEFLAAKERVRVAATALEPQKVEIYGGGSQARFFQYEGPHSPGREYHCGAKAPWNTRVDELPLFPYESGPLLDRADAILAEHLTVIPDPPDDGRTVVYDLTPETMFHFKGGGGGTVEELTVGLPRGPENCLRGCTDTSLLGSSSQENCTLFITDSGRVLLTDWSRNGRKHYMASDAPAPHFEFNEETAAVLRSLASPPPPPPPPLPPLPPLPPNGEIPPPPSQPFRRARSFYELEVTADSQDNYTRAINWMAQELGFCAAANKGKGGVYSLWPGGQWHRHPLALTSLRTLMQPYAIVNVGPQGGLHVRSPVDAWLTGNVRDPDDNQRFDARLRAASIDGLRFRPDLAEPIFRDGTKQYLNLYAPPDHPTTGGDTRVFHDFMVHLVPDTDDRRLTWQWLAYKIQHPWEPLFTLMMAAPGAFGTGRGTLGIILGRVLGEDYAMEVNFDELTGRSAASRWTAAAIADKLLIMVHEAAGDEEGHKLMVRTAGYERLKLMLDNDSESLRTREAKGEMPYQQRSSCSCIITTNHKNPVRMPVGERRLAVVRNGEVRMTPEQRAIVRGWARNPANIGALGRELKAMLIDAGFDPQEPPMNIAKEKMVELSKTELDIAWEAAHSAMRGKLFTCMQAIELMRMHGDLERFGAWEAIARRRMTDWADWLRQSANASRVSYQGKQQVVYVREKSDLKLFAYNAGTEAIQAELDKTQKGIETNRHLVVVHTEHSERDQ